MPTRMMMKCTRCGKVEPYTIYSSIHAHRLMFSKLCRFRFGMHEGPEGEVVDLCKDCWKDFEEFVYKYKED